MTFFLTGIEIAAGISIWEAIAISAALSAAEFLLQRALTPKPKPLEKGKLSGETQIQDSRFGLMEPELYGGLNNEGYLTGGNRVAGNIIWSSQIRKIVTTEQAGGKGGPSQEVKTTTYYQDVAICWGIGPQRLLKLWAGPKLVLDITGNSAVSGVNDSGVASDGVRNVGLPPDPEAAITIPQARYSALPNLTPGTIFTAVVAKLGTVRHYEGRATQNPDPLIQADVDGRLGANSTPAYRGKSYTVIENLNISEYGGFMPNFTALVVNLETHSLTHLTTSYAQRVGLLASDLNLSSSSGVNLRGVPVTNVQSPRQTLEALARIYNMEWTESNGKFTSVPRGSKVAVQIPFSKLGARNGINAGQGNEIPELLEIKIKDTPQIPREVRVTFLDPGRDFQNNTQNSPPSQIGDSQRVIDLQYPVVLTPDEAAQIAARELYSGRVERVAYGFKLPWEYAYLVPTDVVEITDTDRTHRIRLLQISGAAPGVLECAGVADDEDVWPQSVSGVSGDSTIVATIAAPASTILALIDVALLRDRDNDAGVYLAVAEQAFAGSGWRGAAVYRNTGNGNQLAATFTVSATMGTAVTVMAAATNTTDFDPDATVDVALYGDSILENKTELQVLNGANALLIGDEIIQFTTAQQLGGFANRWRLTNLLRARKGTDWAAASHVVNERVVLLDDKVQFFPMEVGERNIQRTWQAVTSGQAVADAATWAFTYQVRNLMPLSVVDVQGTRDGSNNLTLTWKRRSRISGQWIDGSDVPVGEEAEEYSIDVMSGSTVKRTINTTSETASYTAADATTDGLAPAGPVTFRIYQISAKVGRGFVRETAI